MTRPSLPTKITALRASVFRLGSSSFKVMSLMARPACGMAGVYEDFLTRQALDKKTARWEPRVREKQGPRTGMRGLKYRLETYGTSHLLLTCTVVYWLRP